MKAVWTGLEGSGKSYKIAMFCHQLVKRNNKWRRKSKIIRPIHSNMRFSEAFETYAKKMGVPIVYWSQLEELVKVTDADVIVDELGNYFDARMWSELSLDVRSWLAQADKIGVEMYGTAQDFAQIDNSFRRLTTDLFLVKKVIGSGRPSATRPPIKVVWGLIAMFRIEPQNYKEDDKKYLSYIPSFSFLSKEYTDIFDTRQKIARPLSSPMKHIERDCSDPNCGYHKVVHI